MLAIVLALAMVQTADLHDADRGSRLYLDCKAGIRFSETGASATLSADSMAANSCVGYIQGFVQATELYGPKVCAKGASWGTMARVFVSYMDAHPMLMDQHRALDLSEALMQAYPCVQPK